MHKLSDFEMRHVCVVLMLLHDLFRIQRWLFSVPPVDFVSSGTSLGCDLPIRVQVDQVRARTVCSDQILIVLVGLLHCGEIDIVLADTAMGPAAIFVFAFV